VSGADAVQHLVDTDPETTEPRAGQHAGGALTARLAWCAGWSLLSKIFTRRSHFWWHVRVLLLGVLAIDVAGAMSRLLAFSLSWPTLSDFSLRAALRDRRGDAVLPRARRRAAPPAAHARGGVGMFIAGTALSLWFNRQNRDQFGDELYMNHLFPPALRVARPIDTDASSRTWRRCRPARREGEEARQRRRRRGASDEE
jgi:hypothetical protein